MNSSLFKRVSLGIAAETIKPGTRQLEVIPIESNGFLNGELVEGDVDLTASGSDHSGLEYQSKVITSNSVSAVWYPGSSNSLTPPTITKGEQVGLYKYGDSDQYYWTPEGQSDHLRPTDTFGARVSAKGTKDEDELDESNSYFMEMSSDSKRIRLKTSMKNGEKAAFDAFFNLEEGWFEVTDQKGTYIQLNSTEEEISLEVNGGSKLYLEKKKILMEAPDEIRIKTKKLITDTTETEMTAKTKHSTKSALVDISGATTKFSGSSLSFSYASSSASSGNFTWGGTHNYTTTITHNGINIGSDHKHTGVRGGSDTSGAVSG